ncbi:MerR family transcriptional regulator [Cohnella mopanensis]|uniref:MerR family transcriptional regulator n=1 Tax=Cohnella mopanensis TaxID=2911966 RepID=UPI001EF83F5A|nr:MerR family transcriptional regulator [Cohnella mopanensis]
MEKQYSIKEVSRILGISKDTLRYYDRIGIVSPSREHNSYRRYSRDDLVDLMNIQIMQYADFTLEEIKGKFQFHRMQSVDPAYCEEVADFLDAKKAETRKKIAHLEKVSQLLDVAVETLRDLNH